MLKKLFIMFTCSLLLSSCNNVKNTKQKNIVLQETTSPEKTMDAIIDTKKSSNYNVTNDGTEILEDIDKRNETVILYFDNNQVLYWVDESINYEEDTANEALYSYNIMNKKKKLVCKISSVSLSSGNLAVYDNILYYPLAKSKSGKKYNYILQVNLDNLENKLMELGGKSLPLFDLLSTKKELLLFHRIPINDKKTEYLLDKISPKSKTGILKTSYDGKQGELITSVCAENKKLFSYSTISKAGKSESYIKEYNLDGKLMKTYLLDMDSFFVLEGVDDLDAIYNMYKVNDCFILNSLNSRNYIVKLVGDKLERIPVPEELESFELGGNVIDDFSGTSDFVYFQPVINRNHIYVFDSLSNKYHTIRIEGNNEVNSIVRDAFGNMIIATLDTNGDYRFFYVPLSKLYTG